MKWTNCKKFLKNWGSLIIAILALFSSSYAVYIDNKHYDQSLALQSQQYEELTKPHTEHEEVLDKLRRLEERIKTAREWVRAWEPPWAATFRENLSKAEQLSIQADEAWRKKDYNKAGALIDEAYESVNKIKAPLLFVQTSLLPSNVVNDQGMFTIPVSVSSPDGQLRIHIEKGTTGKDKNGNPLTMMTIVEMDPTKVPPLPRSKFFVGLTYDIGPDDAVFEPFATLTLTYDPSSIPSGADEEDLAVGYWNAKENEWQLVDSAVEPATNTVSARVNHFTLFTLLAELPQVRAVYWGLLGGIATATVTIVGILIYFLVVRRMRK